MYGVYNVVAGSAGREGGADVQSEQAEEIAVRSRGGTGTAIAGLAEVIGALSGTRGHLARRDFDAGGRDVPDEPMGEGATRGVGVLDDQTEGLRAGGDAGDFEGWRSVVALAGKAGGDEPAGPEVRAAEAKGVATGFGDDGEEKKCEKGFWTHIPRGLSKERCTVDAHEGKRKKFEEWRKVRSRDETQKSTRSGRSRELLCMLHMTAEPNPFPTVRKLAIECGVEWPHFHEAARQTAQIERVFKEAIEYEAPGSRVLDTDSSLVLFGSFARYEMVADSDCDWTLLINGVVNNRHPDDAGLIHRAIKKAADEGKGLAAPSPRGAFGNLCFSHDLVHKIGGGADSNENLTRRILMLLESRAVSLSPADSAVEVWQAVVRNILERYFEEDVHFSQNKKVPRFLLNDLTRYWRTICVDYAAKHREEAGAKWAVRNAKLRLSRKLLYAEGLAFCFRCQLAPPTSGIEEVERTAEPFIAAAMEFAAAPPLEYLATFIDEFIEGERRRLVSASIFGAYDKWLELIGDSEKRERLKNLSHENAHDDKTFNEVRWIGAEFAKGLKLLFFGRERDDDKISNLSLEYVGF